MSLIDTKFEEEVNITVDAFKSLSKNTNGVIRFEWCNEKTQRPVQGER